MKILFIGGTGIISTASTRLAAERGIELTLLRRGQRSADVPKNVDTITADVTDEAATANALGTLNFDAVVDWIVQTPADVERDIRLFRDRTRQYIFISSASAYQRPVGHYLITESTPLANPYWQYSRNKIACEERLMQAYREEGFPITIVRPIADLWGYADCVADKQLGEVFYGCRPDAAGQEGDCAGRRIFAVGDYAQQRFCAGAGGTAGTSNRPLATPSTLPATR